MAIKNIDELRAGFQSSKGPLEDRIAKMDLNEARIEALDAQQEAEKVAKLAQKYEERGRAFEVAAIQRGLDSAHRKLGAVYGLTGLADEATMQEFYRQDERVEEAFDLAMKMGDLSEARQFWVKGLKSATDMLATSATVAATGGIVGAPAMAGVYTIYGMDTLSREYHNARGAGLSKGDSWQTGATMAAIEIGTMAAFHGASKVVPGFQDIDAKFAGLFKKGGTATSRGLGALTGGATKDTGSRVAAEAVTKAVTNDLRGKFRQFTGSSATQALINGGGEVAEEVVTSIGQTMVQAARIPGAENAANWEDKNGDVWDSPMMNVIKHTVWDTTAAMMFLTGPGPVSHGVRRFLHRPSRTNAKAIESLLKASGAVYDTKQLKTEEGRREAQELLLKMLRNKKLGVDIEDLASQYGVDAESLVGGWQIDEDSGLPEVFGKEAYEVLPGVVLGAPQGKRAQAEVEQAERAIVEMHNELGAKYGYKLRIVDSGHAEGVQSDVDGIHITSDKTIWMTRKRVQQMTQGGLSLQAAVQGLYLHELGHSLEQTDSYDDLVDYILEHDKSGWLRARKAYKDADDGSTSERQLDREATTVWLQQNLKKSGVLHKMARKNTTDFERIRNFFYRNAPKWTKNGHYAKAFEMIREAAREAGLPPKPFHSEGLGKDIEPWTALDIADRKLRDPMGRTPRSIREEALGETPVEETGDKPDWRKAEDRLRGREKTNEDYQGHDTFGSRPEEEQDAIAGEAGRLWEALKSDLGGKPPEDDGARPVPTSESTEVPEGGSLPVGINPVTQTVETEEYTLWKLRKEREALENPMLGTDVQPAQKARLNQVNKEIEQLEKIAQEKESILDEMADEPEEDFDAEEFAQFADEVQAVQPSLENGNISHDEDIAGNSTDRHLGGNTTTEQRHEEQQQPLTPSHEITGLEESREMARQAQERRTAAVHEHGSLSPQAQAASMAVQEYNAVRDRITGESLLAAEESLDAVIQDLADAGIELDREDVIAFSEGDYGDQEVLQQRVDDAGMDWEFAGRLNDAVRAYRAATAPVQVPAALWDDVTSNQTVELPVEQAVETQQGSIQRTKGRGIIDELQDQVDATKANMEKEITSPDDVSIVRGGPHLNPVEEIRHHAESSFDIYAEDMSPAAQKILVAAGIEPARTYDKDGKLIRVEEDSFDRDQVLAMLEAYDKTPRTKRELDDLRRELPVRGRKEIERTLHVIQEAMEEQGVEVNARTFHLSIAALINRLITMSNNENQKASLEDALSKLRKHGIAGVKSGLFAVRMDKETLVMSLPPRDWQELPYDHENYDPEGLLDPGYGDEEAHDSPGLNDDDIGSRVQWTSQGVDQFATDKAPTLVGIVATPPHVDPEETLYGELRWADGRKGHALLSELSVIRDEETPAAPAMEMPSLKSEQRKSRDQGEFTVSPRQAKAEAKAEAHAERMAQKRLARKKAIEKSEADTTKILLQKAEREAVLEIEDIEQRYRGLTLKQQGAVDDYSSHLEAVSELPGGKQVLEELARDLGEFLEVGVSAEKPKLLAIRLAEALQRDVDPRVLVGLARLSPEEAVETTVTKSPIDGDSPIETKAPEAEFVKETVVQSTTTAVGEDQIVKGWTGGLKEGAEVDIELAGKTVTAKVTSVGKPDPDNDNKRTYTVEVEKQVVREVEKRPVPPPREVEVPVLSGRLLSAQELGLVRDRLESENAYDPNLAPALNQTMDDLTEKGHEVGDVKQAVVDAIPVNQALKDELHWSDESLEPLQKSEDYLQLLGGILRHSILATDPVAKSAGALRNHIEHMDRLVEASKEREVPVAEPAAEAPLSKDDEVLLKGTKNKIKRMRRDLDRNEEKWIRTDTEIIEEKVAKGLKEAEAGARKQLEERKEWLARERKKGEAKIAELQREVDRLEAIKPAAEAPKEVAAPTPLQEVTEEIAGSIKDQIAAAKAELDGKLAWIERGISDETLKHSAKELKAKIKKLEAALDTDGGISHSLRGLQYEDVRELTGVANFIRETVASANFLEMQIPEWLRGLSVYDEMQEDLEVVRKSLKGDWKAHVDEWSASIAEGEQSPELLDEIEAYASIALEDGNAEERRAAKRILSNIGTTTPPKMPELSGDQLHLVTEDLYAEVRQHDANLENLDEQLEASPKSARAIANEKMREAHKKAKKVQHLVIRLNEKRAKEKAIERQAEANMQFSRKFHPDHSPGLLASLIKSVGVANDEIARLTTDIENVKIVGGKDFEMTFRNLEDEIEDLVVERNQLQDNVNMIQGTVRANIRRANAEGLTAEEKLLEDVNARIKKTDDNLVRMAEDPEQRYNDAEKAFEESVLEELLERRASLVERMNLAEQEESDWQFSRRGTTIAEQKKRWGFKKRGGSIPAGTIADPEKLREYVDLIEKYYSNHNPTTWAKETAVADSRWAKPNAKETLNEKIRLFAEKKATLSTTDVINAHKLMDEEYDAWFEDRDNKELIESCANATDRFLGVGSELGRLLNFYRRKLSPEERIKKTLGEAMMSPPKSIKDKMIDYTRKGRHDKAEKLFNEWKYGKSKKKKNLHGLQEFLKTRGWDLGKIHKIIGNPSDARRLLDNIGQYNSSLGDKLFEYWRNSILSGPATQIANLIGTLGFAAYEIGIKRNILAAANTFLNSPDLPTFAEQAAVVKSLLATSIAEARINGLEAWRTEQHVLEDKLFSSGLEVDATRANRITEGKSTAIGGPQFKIGRHKTDLGRVIRAPQRGLLAVDEWMKTCLTNSYAAGFAYRAANKQVREGKLDPESKAAFMEGLLDPSVRAEKIWMPAYNEALRQTWQTPLSEAGKLGKVGQKVIELRESIPLLRFIVPFVVTPVNIFRTGVSMSPLNWLPKMQKWNQMRKDGEIVEDRVGELGEDVANAILVGIPLLMIMGQDDEDPWITGTEQSVVMGRERYPSGREGSLPSYSVKLPFTDRWISYSRIEPFATLMGVTVDVANSIKRLPEGVGDIANPFVGLYEQFKEKTFLRGLGDLQRAVEKTAQGEFATGAGGWATSMAVSWIPNLFRAPARATQDRMPDRKVYGETSSDKLSSWAEGLARRTEVLPAMGLVEDLPKVDMWGRDYPRHKSFGKGLGMGDFLYKLLVPAQIRTTHQFVGDETLRNYNVNNPDNQWAGPEAPNRYLTIKKKKTWMSPDQYEEYCRMAGGLAAELCRTLDLNVDNPSRMDKEKIQDAHKRSRQITTDILSKKWWGDGDESAEIAAVADEIHRNMIKAKARILAKRPPNLKTSLSREEKRLPYAKKKAMLEDRRERLRLEKQEALSWLESEGISAGEAARSYGTRASLRDSRRQIRRSYRTSGAY